MKNNKSINKLKNFGTKDLLKRLAEAILVISGIIAILSVIKTALVPLKYLLIIIPIYIFVVIFLIYLSFNDNFKSNKKRVACWIFNILIIIFSIFIISICNNISSFLENINKQDYHFETYSIITKKDSGVELTTNNKNSGIINNDSNKNDIIKIIKEKTNANVKTYDNLTNITSALNSREVDTITINNSYLSLLDENYNEFYKSIKVLYEFKIKVQDTNAKSNTDITKPFVIYISGIDTYGEVTSVSRSDVNILAVVNPEKRKILLVNTPRDYYVQLHSTTGVRDKLTHAGIYGIDMSKNTLQDLYNTEINYYVRVNFTSLLEIIDAIGGIEVYSDYSFKTNHYSFKEGYNQLDSKQALEFSRERHAFEGGDNTRGRNQQRVIEAIIMKASNPTELIKYQNTLKLLGNSIQTDMSRDEITRLLNQQMDTLKKWQTESIAVTGTGKTATTYSMGSMPLYVMEPNSESLFIAKETIQSYKK